MAEGCDCKIEVNTGREGVVESWIEHHTWKVPVIIFTPCGKSRSRLKERTLIEGHTRVGILKGLSLGLSEKYEASEKHLVIDLIEK